MLVDDQNEAWRRLTDARLQNLERAVQPARIRRGRKGKPLPPLPYEPGDRLPLTKWLELRQLATEMLLQLLLAADRLRADELDVPPIEDEVEIDLGRMDEFLSRKLEPDIVERETIAMILQARIILMESHTWPLMALEESGT